MSNQTLEVTKHFRERCKARLGISKKEAIKYFYRAYAKGLRKEDFKNNKLFYRYLEHLEEGNIECIVYCHYIIITVVRRNNSVLAITILNVPPKYIYLVDLVLERRQKRHEKRNSSKNKRRIQRITE